MAEDQLNKEYDREISFNTIYTDDTSSIISVTNNKLEHYYIEASFGVIHITHRYGIVPDVSIFSIKDADVKRIIKAVLDAGYSGFQEAHAIYKGTFLNKCALLGCKMLPVTLEVNMDTIDVYSMELNCIAKCQGPINVGGFKYDANKI